MSTDDQLPLGAAQLRKIARRRVTVQTAISKPALRTSPCLLLSVILRTYKRAFTLSLLTKLLTPDPGLRILLASASCVLRVIRISDDK